MYVSRHPKLSTNPALNEDIQRFQIVSPPLLPESAAFEGISCVKLSSSEIIKEEK